MRKIFTILFFCFAALQVSHAQVLPAEDSKLNYRLIEFSFPAMGKTVKYTVEIAAGTHNTDGEFTKNIFAKKESKTDRMITEVPSFGSQYTWRAVYTAPNSTVTKSVLHHFSTTTITEVDTNTTRLRIIDPAVKYNDAYVFIDGNKALYDMKGNAVWHLPEIKGETGNRSMVRDLKLSSFGTITLLLDDRAYEINLNGTVLWKAPNDGKVSGEKTEHYHHEFTRLRNGHYMILGTESVAWTNKYAVQNDSLMRTRSNSNAKREIKDPKTNFGTIIEYDEKGNVVWSWKSSKYFIGSDIEHYNPQFRMPVVDVHENSFYFDEKDSTIYVGFKNIARIVKVKYPEGIVTGAYGEVYRKDVAVQGNGLFCDQHSARVSEKGELYLFNNNACNSDKLPTVIMMQQPHAKNGSLKKIWEYECNDKDVPRNPRLADIEERRKEAQKKMANRSMDQMFRMRPTSGGNVLELPDHSFFVCMNTEYCKIFIVSPEKNILWNAIPEKYLPKEKVWVITPQQYRASIIDRKQLETLIRNSSASR